LRRYWLYARRVFVTAWIGLGVLGALNHTIAQDLLGRRFDLRLPHLRYGYVMFNQNPRQVIVAEYEGEDGIRHNLADLVATPAPGYKRTRVAVNLLLKPRWIDEICYRAIKRKPDDRLTFFIREYDLDEDPDSPVRTNILDCSRNGLIPR
jgi:hypothetical protein